MSLFSTIAHDGPVPARGMPRRIWMMGAGLVLTATVGFVIANSTAGEQADTATSTSTRLAHDEFIRINTTALDALVPPAAAVESPSWVDPFIYINTTALDGLAPATVAIQTQGDVPFIYINTTALDDLALAASAGYSEQSNGPR